MVANSPLLLLTNEIEKDIPSKDNPECHLFWSAYIAFWLSVSAVDTL